jgi:hypothetical protein
LYDGANGRNFAIKCISAQKKKVINALPMKTIRITLLKKLAGRIRVEKYNKIKDQIIKDIFDSIRDSRFYGTKIKKSKHI